MHRFHTDMDDPADCGDQVLRLFEPVVGVVYDAAMLVLVDPVAVDEPLKRGPAIDLIEVSLAWNTSQSNAVIDDDGCSFLFVDIAHGPRADPEMLRFRLSVVCKLNLERVLLQDLQPLDGKQLIIMDLI